MKVARANSKGFLLIPVVVAIAIIGVLAYYSANESAVNVSASNSEFESARADYVAHAGLQHALAHTAIQGCGPYTDLTDVPIGNDKYGTSLTTALGSTTTHMVAVDQDGWVRDDDPSRVHATDIMLHFRSDGITERPVYRYDLSKIPAQSTVISARAYFYVLKAHAESPVDIHALTADWTEANASWDQLGGAMATQVQATVPVQPTIGVWVSVNLTSLVQGWINGQSNFGIAMSAGGDSAHGEYASRESTNAPYLEVVTGTLSSSQAALKAVGTLESGIKRSLIQNDVTLLQSPAQFIHWQNDGSQVADAYIWETNKTTNYGNDDEVWVSHSNNNSSRSLFKFPTKTIPRGARIQSATLSLFHESGNDADVPITAHRILKGWNENEVTWQRRRSGRDWDTPGGDFDSGIVSTTLVGPASFVRYEWDLTSLVQGWVSGTYKNRGVALATDQNGAFGERFYSSDEPGYTRLPRLTISYTCDCGTICTTLQGSGRIAFIGDDWTPDADDEPKIDMLESWGYEVDFYMDRDSGLINWGLYDLAYVSETAISGDVHADLKGYPIGVVNEEPGLYDDLLLASGHREHVGASIDIVDNSHFITSVFPLGELPIYSRDMEVLSATAPLAPGLSVLGEFNGGPSLTAINSGAETTSGAATGRRVTLPFGQHANAGFDWTHLSHNGLLLVQRAIEWGITGQKTSLGDVLLVVGNSGSPSSKDTGRQTLMESWGYSVSLIDDGDSQANFDAAAAASDVVFVSGTINGGTLADKLTKSTTPIVNEFGGKLDNFGFSSGTGNTVTYNGFTATNTLQYIGEPFSGAAVTHFTTNLTMPVVTGTPAPGIVGSASLGTLTNALATLDTGALRWDNDPSPARRVHLPFGAAEVNQLTDDGESLMRRAIEWASGSGCGVSKPLLMVVGDDANLVSSESGRKTLMESWCYGVTTIDDNATQTDFNNAAAASDVVYITGTMDPSTLGSKLNDSPTPIVNEHNWKLQHTGFYQGSFTATTDAGFSHSNASHYIAEPFSGGPITIFNSPLSIVMADPSVGTFAAGADIVTNADGGAEVALLALEATAQRWDDTPAVARRVYLPYKNADTTDLTTDGVTLMRRAIDWAAGAGPNPLLPIAHWKLDETSGTTAMDSEGGHDGTLVSTPNWSTGRLDGALEFDGVDDYVNLTSDAELNDVFAGGASVSAWLYLYGWGEGAYGRVLDKTSAISGQRDGWMIGTDGGNQTIAFAQGFTTERGFWRPQANTVSLNEWVHYAIVYNADSTANDPVIYLNGVAQTSLVEIAPVGTIRSDAGIALRMGNYAQATTRTLDGKIDDVRIYDYALSATDIADLAAQGGGSGSGSGGGGTPPVFEEFSDARRDTNGTSLSIPKPGGAVAGDLLIAALVTDGDRTASFTPPTGWNLVSQGGNASGRVGLGVWWKIATGSEPASYNFTWTGNEQAYGWVMRFTNHDPTSPVLFDNGALNNDNTTAPICQRLTTPVDNMLVLRIGGFDDDDVTIGDPGLDGHTAINMDESGTGNASTSGGSGYFVQETAGDSGLGYFQLTRNEQMRTVTLGIRPAP